MPGAIRQERDPARLFRFLLDRYGAQHWWPARDAFEVMVGAILTQNTAWTNAERAIEQLRSHQILDPRRVVQMPDQELAALIRPAGCFNIKTARLKALCTWLLRRGGVESLKTRDTAELRASLLAVRGIGKETADAILLYALDRPVFVVDAYTFRIFERFGLIEPGHRDYEDVRSRVERALDYSTQRFNEFHALLVEHGKRACRPKPWCSNCCLSNLCARQECGKA